jgi:hypothetical protein
MDICAGAPAFSLFSRIKNEEMSKFSYTINIWLLSLALFPVITSLYFILESGGFDVRLLLFLAGFGFLFSLAPLFLSYGLLVLISGLEITPGRKLPAWMLAQLVSIEGILWLYEGLLLGEANFSFIHLFGLAAVLSTWIATLILRRQFLSVMNPNQFDI